MRRRAAAQLGVRRLVPVVRAYGSERYVVGAKTTHGSSKLFQIAFGSDASLYVAFPYISAVPGQFGRVHLKPGEGSGAKTTIQTGPDFMATEHHVKYSHHPSGRAHFSLSGKVRPIIYRDAVPLHAHEGHLFTVMLQGLSKYSAATPKDRGTTKRGVVMFGFQDAPTEALKYLGMLYSERTLARRIHMPGKSPWLKVIKPDGTLSIGIVLATPIVGRSQRMFLLLSAERIPIVSKNNEAFLSMLGGFDPPEIALNPDNPTSFLTFFYPSSTSYEDLQNKLGTADIPPRA